MIVGGALGEIMPWRSVFLVLVVLPLVSATLIGRFVPEPARLRGRAPVDPGDAGPGIGEVFRHRDLWVLGIAGIAPIWTQWLIGTWGPALFAEVGVRELGSSALYASLLGIAALPGLFTMGTLSDRLLRRGIGRKVVFASGILCMAILTALMG